MNERPTNHTERYQAMTPKQRNAEMRSIFALLPRFEPTRSEPGMDPQREIDNTSIDLTNQTDKRRINSELRKDLLLRFKSLLSFSPTTDSFKAYIANEYDQHFQGGVLHTSIKIGDRLIPIDFIEFLAKRFQWNDTKSGGIFDPDNGKEIERAIYREAVNV